MKTTLAYFLSSLALSNVVVADIKPVVPHLKRDYGLKAVDHSDPDVIGSGTFQQNLDHDDLQAGTFSQRYWWDASNYKKGGPIFLFNPGESAADSRLGFLGNTTLSGLYAQEYGGAAIVIEHRYWGESVPFDQLTAETLQYLNLPNSVRDMTNFALNVDLEFCDDGPCTPDAVPWVLVGGSYSGALAAWVSQLEPGVFHAYHASSAVVEAIHDFWTYYSPVEQALPRNCSSDVKAVISHVDYVFSQGDEEDISDLKAKFNMQNLNAEDFATQLAVPLSQWQTDQDAVIAFCDYIETYTSTSKAVLSSTTGVGLVAALEAYAAYVNATSECGDGGSSCDSWTASIQWNKPSELDDDRPWYWMLCNEPFGWYQNGPPTSDGNSIISSQLRPEQFSRRCDLRFPETNGFVSGAAAGFTEEQLNMYTLGWDAPFQRVLFVNGEFDPWRSATLSSDYRPGGTVNSTDIPVFIVEGGVHCPDLYLDDGNPHQVEVVNAALQQMGQWLQEYRPWKGA
ncbi:peptidase S28 [Xylariales sp. PMI_506]|nr:peptidase S28 [Xylariales sp. PMI_506]